MSHWVAFWPPTYNVKRGHGVSCTNYSEDESGLGVFRCTEIFGEGILNHGRAITSGRFSVRLFSP